MDLPNCRKEEQLNCARLLTGCPTCAAGYGEKNNYTPKDPSLKHAYLSAKKSLERTLRREAQDENLKRKKLNRIKSMAGRAIEKDIIKKLRGILEPTLASGAVFQDGDFKNALNLIIDSKLTHKKQQSIVVSKDYVEKLMSGAVDVYIISNDPTKYDAALPKSSVVCMSLEVFKALLLGQELE